VRLYLLTGRVCGANQWDSALSCHFLTWDFSPQVPLVASLDVLFSGRRDRPLCRVVWFLLCFLPFWEWSFLCRLFFDLVKPAMTSLMSVFSTTLFALLVPHNLDVLPMAGPSPRVPTLFTHFISFVSVRIRVFGSVARGWFLSPSDLSVDFHFRSSNFCLILNTDFDIPQTPAPFHAAPRTKAR